jgi:hypothetical protein
MRSEDETRRGGIQKIDGANFMGEVGWILRLVFFNAIAARMFCEHLRRSLFCRSSQGCHQQDRKGENETTEGPGLGKN